VEINTGQTIDPKKNKKGVYQVQGGWTEGVSSWFPLAG
jgi:hypothetical protein